MADFPFYYTIPVRYGDLDAQWHVNNAKFLTYLEQARLAYLMELGLFDGRSFLDLGLIVADIHIAYRRPLKLGQVARVGVRVERMGNKSLTLANEIQIGDTGLRLPPRPVHPRARGLAETHRALPAAGRLRLHAWPA